MATYYHDAPKPKRLSSPRYFKRAWHLIRSASPSSRSGLGVYLVVLLIACVPVVGWIYAQGVWYEYARKIAWGVDEGFHIPDEPLGKLCVTGLRVVALEVAFCTFWYVLMQVILDGLFILFPFIPLLGIILFSLMLSLSLRMTLSRSMREAVRVKPLFQIISAGKRYFTLNIAVGLIALVVCLVTWLVCSFGLELISEAFRGFTVIHEAFLWGVPLLAAMICMTLWIVVQALWMRQFMENNQSDDLIRCSCGLEHDHAGSCQHDEGTTCSCGHHHHEVLQPEGVHTHDECTSQGQTALKRGEYPVYRQPPKRD